MGLAEARDKRDAARRLIADGVDPMVEKNRKNFCVQNDASITFRSVVEEWLIKITREGRAECTVAKVRWLLIMVS